MLDWRGGRYTPPRWKARRPAVARNIPATLHMLAVVPGQVAMRTWLSSARIAPQIGRYLLASVHLRGRQAAGRRQPGDGAQQTASLLSSGHLAPPLLPLCSSLPCPEPDPGEASAADAILGPARQWRQGGVPLGRPQLLGLVGWQQLQLPSVNQLRDPANGVSTVPTKVPGHSAPLPCPLHHPPRRPS